MAEIRQILGHVPGVELLDLDQAGVPPGPAEQDLEPYDSFEENARSKASYFHGVTGLATVADDSGIEVDALGGAPGVRSKRFAPARGLAGAALDAANNRYLIERLRGVPAEERTARYVCVASLVSSGARPRAFRGEAPGVIVAEPRGAAGFGYDPHVLDPEAGRTFAEMSAAEKNARSHRGKAFRALARTLRERPADPGPVGTPSEGASG